MRRILLLAMFVCLTAESAWAQTTVTSSEPKPGLTRFNPPVSFAAELDSSSAPRQAATMVWSPMVLGGLLANGGAGVAIGGGVRGMNFMSNEKYALQIDGLWSNANFCSACDDPFFNSIEYSGSEIAIAASFLYMLNESSGGWRPHVGGGIVFVRWSINVSSNIIVPVAFGTSGTSGGIQIQGGVTRDRLTIEARAMSAVGGGAAVLVGYRFGGS